MVYSLDLRKRVLDFIATGGSKTEASRRFSVARSTLYKWLNAPDPFKRHKPGPRRPRTLDPDALRKHVADFPDQTYAERAAHFGVSKSCIGYGLKNIGCTRKKSLGYKERCAEKRQAYLQQLAQVKASGKSLVYVDESGFRDESYRRYGYAPKGEKVFGLISSQRTRTTTLIAARFEDTFTVARVFKGSCKAVDFNGWLAEQLCPRLTAKQVVILDNARLHKTPRTRVLIEGSGASLMFLPPYSPDYNPIEHDFANIKRYREYHPETTLHDSIQMYH